MIDIVFLVLIVGLICYELGVLHERAGRECPTCHNAYQGQPAPTFVSAAPSPAEPPRKTAQE
jgi:hypothetical protein